MMEIELRVPVKDTLELEKRLADIGFEYAGSVWHKDTYYDNEDHDIERSDRALRIRLVKDTGSGETKTIVTYKGMNVSDISNARQEKEFEIDDRIEYEKKLSDEGYLPAEPSVEKVRKIYSLNGIMIYMDDVCGLGPYMEVEKITGEYSDKVQQELENILKICGYDRKDCILSSYLDMLQDKDKDRTVREV